ncbi:hypothetical protein [Actinomarinicola tropica]|uniref:Uncharacterized protein n=1 Tax=Actinomarinicola tropica TaxID=2789776 RepID=A0A5Q2RPQ5_9ACTN|nr:hypothetical protein [Actinomarinicola tropica]QGG96426.1 hypothetical protein GH723_15690 [Actinomarinicola tropica]
MSPSSRLRAAAALCVVSLGLGWSTSLASLGYQTPGMNLSTTYVSPISGDLDIGSTYVPGWWVAGDPLRTAKGHESDVRVVLVPAALVLAAAAQRRVRSAQLARATRVAVAAIAILVLVALSRGMLAAAASMVVALALAAPEVSSHPLVRRSSRRFQPVEGG